MESDIGSTSLPGWAFYPATLVAISLFLWLSFFRARNRTVRMAVFIPWFRYLASFYHEFTFKPALAGLSYNALGSSGIFLLGLLLVKRKNLFLKRLLPCYAMMFIVVVSGVSNHILGGTLDAVVKFGYLLVVTLIVYEALGAVDEHRFSKLMLWPFVTPFLFLGLSLVLNVKKYTETDNSISYIGGYHHESGFSIVLATCLVIACLDYRMGRLRRNAIILASLVGILLANYRTTILAMVPLLLAQFNHELLAPFRPSQRRFVVVVTVCLSLLAFLVAAWLLRDRFADLAQAFDPWDRLLKPQYEFSHEDKMVMSARPYIWSGYIYGYIGGGTLQHLIGFGPNSWQGVFNVYAHNSLVSALYEYGPFGVLGMLYLWGSMFAAAVKARTGPKVSLIAAHISFFILNMATMPHWIIEGDILYGILCGYTLHYLVKGYSLGRKPATGGPSMSGEKTVVGGRGNAPGVPR